MSGNDWQTPDLILTPTRHVGDGVIALDPFTTVDNPCCAVAFITMDDVPDGLGANWYARSKGGLTYLNPPFGRGFMEPIADKIVLEARRGCEIIALTRGDMSTRWARQMAIAARLVAFPPRIRFRGATGSPNFSNTIFYYGRRPAAFRRAFADLGPIVAPVSTSNHRTHTHD